MPKNKYLAVAMIAFRVEASDPGEAVKEAEAMKFHDKLGNLRELKKVYVEELATVKQDTGYRQ